MSTRANVVIKSPAQGLSFYYLITSDGYPESTAPDLLAYNGHPDSLLSLDMHPGEIGNWDYRYELDVSKGALKIWDSTMYFQKAPDDWKEKGYAGVYQQNGRGPWGYHNWRKYHHQTKHESDRAYQGEVYLKPHPRYTSAQLKQIRGENLPRYAGLLQHDPRKVHTWLAGCQSEYYDPIYKQPFEDMACMINNRFLFDKEIANWRLKVAA